MSAANLDLRCLPHEKGLNPDFSLVGDNILPQDWHKYCQAGRPGPAQRLVARWKEGQGLSWSGCSVKELSRLS